MANLAELSDKIYLPEDFDHKFTSGEISLSVVNATTTMTLPRFLKDVRGEDTSTEHWISYFPTKSKSKEVGFWKFKRTEWFEVEAEVDDVLEMIRGHREYFRWNMGLIDALTSLYPEAGKKIFSEKYGNLFGINRVYTEFDPISNEEDLVKLVIAANTYPYYVLSEKEAISSAKLLTDNLESFDAINKVLRESRQRQGVQVIYGNNSFNHEGFRNAGDYPHSKRSYSRIDPSHITAVLPIGEYEQKQLLGAV